MKKLFAAFALCACLAGCGAPYTADSINYTIIEDTPSTERLQELRNICMAYNSSEKEYFVDEEKKPLPDKKTFFAEMDDISGNIFAENNTNDKVYRDAQVKDCYIYVHTRNDKEHCITVGTPHYRIREYEKLCENVSKRTGLTYIRAYAGKDYRHPYSENEENLDDFGYTGRNILVFSNPEFELEYFGGSNVYRNAPIQTVLQTEDDEIKRVLVFWSSGGHAPHLTEENLKQLDINDTYGSTAASLVSQYFESKEDAEGMSSGIKYKLRQIETPFEDRHDFKDKHLLILEK